MSCVEIPARAALVEHLRVRAVESLADVIGDAPDTKMRDAAFAAIDSSTDEVLSTMNDRQTERLNDVASRVLSAFDSDASTREVNAISTTDIALFDAVTERILDAASGRCELDADVAAALDLA